MKSYDGVKLNVSHFLLTFTFATDFLHRKFVKPFKTSEIVLRNMFLLAASGKIAAVVSEYCTHPNFSKYRMRMDKNVAQDKIVERPVKTFYDILENT